MVTAYDYPSAIHVARAGIDIVLVGDSVAMVELGHNTTQPMTMDMMLHHCQAVRRGVHQAHDAVPMEPLLVGDMPFASYEFEDTDIALRNAYRFIQEAGMDAVKLEVSRGDIRGYFEFERSISTRSDTFVQREAVGHEPVRPANSWKEVWRSWDTSD
jgi:ketopantoate hydroxymethyltransferase